MKRYTVTIKGFGHVRVKHYEAWSEEDAKALALKDAGISVEVKTRRAGEES